MRIGVFVSGDLGMEVLSDISKEHRIAFVSTNSKSTDIVAFSDKNGVPYIVENPNRGHLFEKMIQNLQFEICISVNYIFLLNKKIIDLCGNIINFHGSILPRYRGRTPHVWAIINNEVITGITAHLVDEGCDTGRILLQKQFPIGHEMTGGDVLNYFVKKYPKIVFEVLNDYQNLIDSAVEQTERYATFYGARKPEDGLINWDWQKERIRNWVRAQAYPYPGAFTFYEGTKMIIDKVSNSDMGYNWDDSNGKILAVEGDRLHIKTPNGAIKTESIRDFEVNSLMINKVLSDGF